MTTNPKPDILGLREARKNDVAHLNPIRYRGYYWDAESGLYYLKSRYYDPQVRRFLNADSAVFTAGTLGTNLFAYCNNNPVMFFYTYTIINVVK